MSVHTNAQEVLLFLAVIIFAFVESHAVEERHHLLHTWFRYTTELFRVYVQISSLSPHGSLKYKETPTEEPQARKKKTGINTNSQTFRQSFLQLNLS